MPGPDPYGAYETIYRSPDEGIWYPDYEESFSWGDFARDALDQAARTAQIIERGYPPGSVVYAPSYPTIPPTGQTPVPYCGPTGCGNAQGVPVAQQTPGAGIQLSSMTLMLIVGGFLLFSLGKSRR